MERRGLTGVPRDSSRERTITNWSIKDWGDGEYSIQGTVTEGNAPNDDRPHFTRTSPIESIDGTVVTTQSGSKYRLLEPSNDTTVQQLAKLLT